MSTGNEIKSRISEIASEMEDGKSRQEVIKEYVEKWNISERTLLRYMAFASDIVRDRMNKRDILLDALRAEHIDECMEKTMRSTMELEARLCAIAEGEIEIEKKVHTKDGVVNVMHKPNYNNMLYAIDRVLKMRGLYRPPNECDTGDRVFKIVVENEEQKRMVESIRIVKKENEEV